MSSGGQQPVTQQTTQSRDPWSSAQPYLQGAMNSASFLYNNNLGAQPYMGQTQAAMDPWLNSGLSSQANRAMQDLYTGGPPGTQEAQTLATNMITNQGLNPELKSLYQQAQGNENPYLQNILNTSNRQISDKIGSSMSGAGRYGSGQHTDVAARAMAEAADPVLAQDYARRQQQMQGIAEGGLQRAGQYSQMLPSLQAMRQQPIQDLLSAGQYMTDRSQASLNDYIKQQNAQQAYPWENLARYNAIVGGAGGLGGTTVTASPITQPSTLQKLLGGGLAGAGIGSAFGGPVGAGAGALGGGLLGLL